MRLRVTDKVPLNDLARVSALQQQALVAVAADVIGSGWYIRGPKVRQWEHDLAGFIGVSDVVGVANGTDALELALRSVATQERRVVVTAANAGGYTSCAARAAGLVPRYADIDPQTLLLDPRDVERVLDGDVAAVVVTHLYGRAADVAPFRRLCAENGTALIEDCAQSIGARTPEGVTGSLGDLATFSFYPTKNLGALGDGGAVATSNADLAARVRALSQYGWARKYSVDLPGGRNSRMDELQAAVLSYRLKSLPEANQRRRDIISRYVDSAPDSVRVLPAEGAHHVAHLAVVVTDAPEVLAEHLATFGIETEVHYPVPDHRQPGLRPDSAHLPVTDSLTGRVLSLPCFPEMTEQEIDRVTEALRSYRCERGRA